MNKHFFLLIALLLAIPTVLADRQTLISTANEFRIDLVRFDPTPFYTGQGTDVWFEITNLKSQALTNFQFTLVDPFPFTVDTHTLTFDRLDAGQKLSFKFHLSADANVKAGSYPISIQFYSPIYQSYLTQKFTVTVQQKQQSITATTVTITPDHVEPGKEATVLVTIRNTLNSDINDVSVHLGVDNASSPFAPVSMTAEQKIKSITIGNEASATFQIIAGPSTTSNVYKIPLQITYLDEFGTQVTKQDTIGIIVQAPIHYQLDLEDTTVHTANTPGKVSISISNRGNANIKYLSITLLNDKNYDILAKNRIYVGNLEPDDFQTADFQLYAHSKGNLKFVVDYQDAFGNEHHDLQEISLPLYSSFAAERYGFITGSSIFSTLFTLLILILLIMTVIAWIRTKSLSTALSTTLFKIYVTIRKSIIALRPRNLKKAAHDLNERAKKA